MKKALVLLLLILAFISGPRALAGEVELGSEDDTIPAEKVNKYTIQEKNDMTILFTSTGVFILIIMSLSVIEIKRRKKE